MLLCEIPKSSVTMLLMRMLHPLPLRTTRDAAHYSLSSSQDCKCTKTVRSGHSCSIRFQLPGLSGLACCLHSFVLDDDEEAAATHEFLQNTAGKKNSLP